MPPLRGGFGVGISFGGFPLSGIFYSLVLGEPLAISVLKTAIVGAIAFLVADACITAGVRIKAQSAVTN